MSYHGLVSCIGLRYCGKQCTPRGEVVFENVMSWGQTEGIPRFYMFGEDLASAYVLCHQTSTVLELWVRDRRRFGGLDGEFEGQSMSISD